MISFVYRPHEHSRHRLSVGFIAFGVYATREMQLMSIVARMLLEEPAMSKYKAAFMA